MVCWHRRLLHVCFRLVCYTPPALLRWVSAVNQLAQQVLIRCTTDHTTRPLFTHRVHTATDLKHTLKPSLPQHCVWNLEENTHTAISAKQLTSAWPCYVCHHPDAFIVFRFQDISHFLLVEKLRHLLPSYPLQYSTLHSLILQIIQPALSSPLCVMFRPRPPPSLLPSSSPDGLLSTMHGGFWMTTCLLEVASMFEYNLL